MNIVLADRMKGLDESATLALNARARRLEHEGKTIYNLTAGELASDTPMYIQEAVASTLHLNKYTPVAGLPELRERIATEARNFYDLDWIEPANVVVTAGAKPALYASLLAIVNPGDEVIVPTPAWVSYNSLIELAGGVVVEVPLTDDFDLDPVVVKASLSPRTRAIILNSPHNPTGAIFSKPALEEVANILSKTKVTVIADDIYARLVYEDFTPVPAGGFKRLVIINGFSKSQALTGWRIGYAIADHKLAVAMTNVLSHVMGNAAVPSQQAALAALDRHDKPPMETMDQLRRQRQLVCQALDAIPSLKYVTPGGAFYVFVDLRAINKNSARWCERLLDETGVALVPGEAFSAPGFARLSFVADETMLKAALRLIKQFVSKKAAA